MNLTTRPITVTRPSEHVLAELGVRTWPIWTCESSTFPWHYDQKETCYLLAGQVTVRAEGREVTFGEGDLVVFPEGMDCVWEVARPVKKHYKFG